MADHAQQDAEFGVRHHVVDGEPKAIHRSGRRHREPVAATVADRGLGAAGQAAFEQPGGVEQFPDLMRRRPGSWSSHAAAPSTPPILSGTWLS